jgi:hypothetical protein
MTGARLPIAGDDKLPAGPVILVGRSKLTSDLDKLIPAGATPQRNEEGLLILGKGQRLLLAGNDDGPYHGTEYAVYEFLERLGVRWFMPGDVGEVVPRRASVELPEVEVRQRPSFKMRNWWGPMTDEVRRLEYRWKLRNKMNPVLHFITLPADSSARSLLSPALAKKEPELFALGADGKRDVHLPNLSNPKSAELAAKTIKEHFKKNPSTTSYGFSPDDGLPRDTDPKTLKLSLNLPDQTGRFGVPAELSVSEEWFTFVNRVARDVGKAFPNHVLTTNGYANRNTPPLGMGVEKNVWIMFAAIWSDTLHAYDNPRSWQAVRQGQMIRRWCELCPNVFMYNYQYVMLASAGTPVPLARKYKRDMPLLKKWGVIGFADEGRSVIGEAGIAPRYLRAKLMWNAGADADAILDEYFKKWYGPAEKPARAFWEALEKALEETPMLGHEDRILPYVYTPELMRELSKQVAAAEKLASADPFKTRVRTDRLILTHLEAYMDMTRAEWACDFAEAVKQADRMLAQRKALHAISPMLFQPDDAASTSGFYYWGVVARRKYYQGLADRTTGKTGEKVAVLPEKARFRTDPRDEGRFAGWENPDFDDREWGEVRTTEPFYAQGHRDKSGYPYMGAMWYRLTVDVPAKALGKKVRLYLPAIETEAWGWVNGTFVGHRPYREAYERPNEVDFDVSAALRPGRNVIVLRVQTGLGAAAQAGGLVSRAFLYTPKP